MQCRQCEDLANHKHGSFMLSERLTRAKDPTSGVADGNAHVGRQVGGTSLPDREAKELMNQRLEMQIAPYLHQELLGAGNWPAGLTRHGGDRGLQVAEFVVAFKWHVRR